MCLLCSTDLKRNDEGKGQSPPHSAHTRSLFDLAVPVLEVGITDVFVASLVFFCSCVNRAIVMSAVYYFLLRDPHSVLFGEFAVVGHTLAITLVALVGFVSDLVVLVRRCSHVFLMGAPL